MRSFRSVVCCLALIAISTACTCAGAPHIVYEGCAPYHNGKALESRRHQLCFHIYTTPTGGRPVWKETVPVLDVSDGKFRARLGLSNPLQLDWTRDYYISVNAGNRGESHRRQKLYRSDDPQASEAVGPDLAYIVADTPLYPVGQTGCDMSIHPGGNWGAAIGRHHEVIAYSNGDDTGSWSSLEPYCQDGYRYQCVEYIRRFYRVWMGMDTSGWLTNADQFYSRGAAWGLQQIANSGASLPQPDDILCMSGGSYGHVAVVTSVGSSVNVIEENASTTSAYGSYPILNGVVQGKWGLAVQGWLRKPGYTITPGTPVLSSPTNSAWVHQTWDVPLTANAAAGAPTPDSYKFTIMDADGNYLIDSGWMLGTTSCTYTAHVEPGRVYRWTAKARCGTSESASASSWSFTLNSAPDQTTLSSPMNSEWSPSTQAVFSWAPTTDRFPGPQAITYALNIRNAQTGWVCGVGSIADTSCQVVVPEDGDYLWKVRSFDGYDFSSWSAENRLIVNTTELPPVEVLGSVKAHADGTQVACGPVNVTAGLDRFADRFYIEQADRSAGLAVSYDTSGGPTVTTCDSLGILRGSLATVNGERVLQLALVSAVERNASVTEPLLVGLRDVVGRPVPGEPPDPDGSGANNFGLLVTAFGRVTYRDPGGTFFYFDDGSLLDDGFGHTGIRVLCTGLATGNSIAPPDATRFVMVNGIYSTALVNGISVRCLRPRTQTDISILQ